MPLLYDPGSTHPIPCCMNQTSLPRVRSISNFLGSLTRIITSHSVFHSLLRWKMIIPPILTKSLNTFLLRRAGRMYFLSLGVKGSLTLLQACIEIGCLWSTVAGCIYMFFPINKLAAGLMVPYLGWVTLASALNYTIWQMNKTDDKSDWRWHGKGRVGRCLLGFYLT